MSSLSHNCSICNASEPLISYKVKEMMFGLGDEFVYGECPSCGCLQLLTIPKEMGKYYPEDYYSFHLQKPNEVKKSFSSVVKNIRNKYAVTGKGFIGKYLYDRFPEPVIASLRYANLTKTSNVLDVGCGNGALLYALREIGFTNTLGIDPYLDKEIRYDNGLAILKQTLQQTAETWDCIMYHHVFEHLENPLQELYTIYQRLNQGGICILRIPTAQSYAWKQYREHWVQLDAPRHIFLHTLKSIELLAKKANLSIKNVYFDSDAFQFWGSEQYKMGIPLHDSRSFSKNKNDGSLFTEQQISAFSAKAKELNKQQEGDSCVIYLCKQ